MPVLSTNLVEAGVVDASFNDELTQVAVAAFHDFTSRSGKQETSSDGSMKRRRRRQSKSTNKESIHLDYATSVKSTANDVFFEYQRTHGYKLAMPSIANCIQVHKLEDEFFNASFNYLQEVSPTRIAEQLGASSGEFSIDLWAAIQKGKGAHHALHVHEGAVLSGVYYSSCFEGCAPLVLRRPLVKSNGCIDAIINQDDVVIEPVEGMLVLFPPWLEHGVPEATTALDEPRVSWPFNLNARLAFVGNPWEVIQQKL